MLSGHFAASLPNREVRNGNEAPLNTLRSPRATLCRARSTPYSGRPAPARLAARTVVRDGVTYRVFDGDPEPGDWKRPTLPDGRPLAIVVRDFDGRGDHDGRRGYGPLDERGHGHSGRPTAHRPRRSRPRRPCGRRWTTTTPTPGRP